MFGMIMAAAAALLLSLISCYLLVKKRDAAHLSLASAGIVLALIEILDQYAIRFSSDPLSIKRSVLFLVSLLPLLFLFFSTTYSRQKCAHALSPYQGVLLALTLLFPASVFAFPITTFFYYPDPQTEGILFLKVPGYWLYIGMMTCFILALSNLETTYSSMPQTDRQKIKYQIVGVSSLIAMLIFYFSQGLLYKAVNLNLLPIRSGVFILASFVLGYSLIYRGNGARVVVSRYIFYRSMTLLGVGLYLVMLGIMGEGLKHFEISYTRELTIFLAFASAILMFLVLLSERLRRLVKVFVGKHFYAHKHDYREEWLKFTGKLALCRTLPDIRDAVAVTYREAFGLDDASLYLLDKSIKQYVPLDRHMASVCLPALRESAGLISYFAEHGRVFHAPDEEYRPSPEEAQFITQCGTKYIVPLICNDCVEGFVTFGRQLTREKFIFEDYDLMKTLARQATLSIVNLRLSAVLHETEEVAAVARISTFVIHDLKNLTCTLSLALENAKDHIGNPEFQVDVVETIGNTVTKMKTLMQRLKAIPEKRELRTEIADLDPLTQEIVKEIRQTRPDREIMYKGTSAFSEVDGEEIGKVIVNLIMNALDAISEKGIVAVETAADGEEVCIRVRDNGCGATEEFLKNHLFKPFRTTKQKGLGIGLYQCKQIVEAHGGTIRLESEPGRGTVVNVFLPAVKNTVYACASQRDAVA